MTTTSTAAEVQNRVPVTGPGLPTVKEDVATNSVSSSMPASHPPVSNPPVSHHQPVAHHQPVSHHQPVAHHQPVSHHSTGLPLGSHPARYPGSASFIGDQLAGRPGLTAPMPSSMPPMSHPLPLHGMPSHAMQPQMARLQARADTVYNTDWGPDEQVTLDATLDKFPPTRHTPLERYIRAAAALPKKGVRDVALRVKWLATHNAAKRRMVDDSASKKRSRVQSIFAVQPKGVPPLGAPVTGVPSVPGVPSALPGAPTLAGLPAVPGIPTPYPPMQAVMPTLDDHGATTVGGVGGPMAQLLEQNYQLLNQYKQNMQHFKVHENTELLCRFRDNLLAILNQMNGMTGLMQHMPPLPVRINVELADHYLPKAGSPSLFAMGMPQATSGAMPGSNGLYMPPHMPPPLPMQPSPMPGSTTVPMAIGADGAKPSISKASLQQNGKAGGGSKSSKSSKSKSGTKKSGGVVKVEAKAETRGSRPSTRAEPVRSSSRTTAVAARNEQKTTPIKSEGVKSSARLAAAAVKSGT